MDYKRIYNQLIERGKNRELDVNEKYQRHHIIPVSVGGGNSKDNLVHLTYREHYIAHALLHLISPDNIPLLRAYCMMAAKFNRKSSSLYSDGMIKKNANAPKKQDHWSWGKKRPDASERMKLNNPMKNPVNKNLVSKKLTGRIISDRVRANMGQAKGIKNNKYAPVISINIETGCILNMGMCETANYFGVDKELIRTRVNGFQFQRGHRKLKEWVFTYDKA